MRRVGGTSKAAVASEIDQALEASELLPLNATVGTGVVDSVARGVCTTGHADAVLYSGRWECRRGVQGGAMMCNTYWDY